MTQRTDKCVAQAVAAENIIEDLLSSGKSAAARHDHASQKRSEMTLIQQLARNLRLTAVQVDHLEGLIELTYSGREVHLSPADVGVMMYMTCVEH